MNTRSKGLWAGWVGTVLSAGSCLAIWQLGAASLAVWVGMMSAGAVLCGYGALRRSRWFWVPALATVLITAGVFWAASHPEP
jgi:hypothetical protein